MIFETKGDLLDAEVDVIAHQVNFHGVMGAGIAAQIKQFSISPKSFDNYRELCHKKKSGLLGGIYYCDTSDNSQIVANLFGQDGPTTDYNALKVCLSSLEEFCRTRNYSVGIPARLGCGLAGGDWSYVLNDIIRPIFEDSPVPLTVVEWDPIARMELYHKM